ncbi:MAG: hypothetical protein AABY30_05310 [Candidatus Thermoplasmatota archaeon]
MDADAWIRASSRLLTIFALLGFLAWLVVQHPAVLVLAALLGVVAYALFWWDQERNPVDVGRGVGSDTQDRVREGSEQAVSPGVSVGGIHLSFETRTRWRTRR